MIIECPSNLHVVASAAAPLPNTALQSLSKGTRPFSSHNIIPATARSLLFQISGAHGLHHRYSMSLVPGILCVWVQVLGFPPECNPWKAGVTSRMAYYLAQCLVGEGRWCCLNIHLVNEQIKLIKNKSRAIRKKRNKERIMIFF